MLKLQNKMNWTLDQRHMSHLSGVSETVPDESLTIKQILERYVRGQPLNAHARVGHFGDTADFDSPDLEELQRMDHAEKSDLARDLKVQNDQKKADLKAAKAAKIAAAEAAKKAVDTVPPATV